MSNNDNMDGLKMGFVIFFVIFIIGMIGYELESKPKCIKAGCDFEVASGSSYCHLHNPYTGSSYTRGSISKSSSSSSNKSTSSSYNSSSYTGKKNVKMPDCDDYEDYDDFMDEWDGRMPDGSDAEDYWENW